MNHERNWETGEGFTNGLSARDIEYLIGVVTDTDYAAYQRGRADAAKAMQGEFIRQVRGLFDAPTERLFQRLSAAARGDGERSE